jgi:hypothetical protein
VLPDWILESAENEALRQLVYTSIYQEEAQQQTRVCETGKQASLTMGYDDVLEE